MKKYLSFVFVLFLISCTNLEEFSAGKLEETRKEVNQTRRSFKEALEIAKKSIGLFSPETRAENERKIDLNETKYILSDIQSRNGVKDTLMYVFNFDNNKGFSVISANKGTEPLLALTEQGFYENGITEVEVPAFGLFMDMAENYVASTCGFTLPEIDMDVPMEIKQVDDTIEVVRIAPKVSTRWGQTGCEATYTPNGYSGCSNTAMAQIMSYFCFPSEIEITYPNASISSLLLNWFSMKFHNVSHNKQTCTASSSAHDAIAHLHRELGNLNNSEYLNEGTSTNTNNVRESFMNLGYTVSTIRDYGDENIHSLLANDKLLYIRGSRIKEIKEGNDTIYSGHGWVLDGYLKHKILMTDWVRKVGETEWTLYMKYEPYYTEYYHMNWGWDGNCNGFFQAGVFNSCRVLENDNITGSFDNNINKDYRYKVRYFSVTK